MRVMISPTGQTATVSGRFHATQVVGLDDADGWVAFYEKLAGGKHGQFYQGALAAFRQARRDMKSRQAEVRDGC